MLRLTGILGLPPAVLAPPGAAVAGLRLWQHLPVAVVVRGRPAAQGPARGRPEGPVMSAVEVEHLSRRYGELPAVADVSFEVATMEILEGYRAPSGGTVRVLGEEPGRAGRAWRARVGLVLQSTSLDPQLTVGEALGIFGALFPRPRPVDEVLELIDLAGEAGTRIGRLSGGQQRRVDVGLGIVGGPRCCSWTSRPPGSTRRPAARPGPPSRA